MATKRKVVKRVQNYNPTLWDGIEGEALPSGACSSGKRKRKKPSFGMNVPRKPKALNNGAWMELYGPIKSRSGVDPRQEPGTEREPSLF